MGFSFRHKGHPGRLASNAAFQPLPNMATYGAAKTFVLHFSEALNAELKGRGVQVMAVCLTLTEGLRDLCRSPCSGRNSGGI